MRRLLIVFAVAGLMATGVAPVAASRPTGQSGIQPANLPVLSTFQAAKTDSGRLAQSDAGLIARKDGALVAVMIKFDLDPVASYQGGVAGLAATSPSATGKTLKQNEGAVGSYARYLEMKTHIIRLAISRAVPGATLRHNFLTAYGGVSAQIPANRAKDLLKVKGVAAVQYDTVNQVTANDSPIFVGATQVWPSLGGSSTAGQGVKIGVLDTGIWPEHPMLADPGIPYPGGSYGCEFGDGIDTDFGDDFTCNDKLIGAYAFLDNNLFFNGIPDAGNFCNAAGTECSSRDPDGHGTHTSTTAGGSPVGSTPLLGVDRGPISGIAPGASLIMYRVCLGGCFSSDSVEAVEQAIVDDVDVINFSISGGANPYTDSVELAFLDAYAAGIEVNASAGNDGPGAATANHAGPWVNTVGASTLDRAFTSTLHLVADNLDTLDISGVTVTAGITSATPVVLASAAPYSDEKCTAEAPDTSFVGMIVVCKRGTNARVDKGYNVFQGDAAGMILYNGSAGQTDQESDNHWLPAIHVQYESDAIVTFMGGHTGVMATWASGVATAAQGDVMASFSSRGPLGDFIKPDVTAPGVQILAGMTPEHVGITTGPQGEYYQAIAGTSMSSPHATGVAALIKASHPGWTPGQIKSAMMTSSLQSVVKEDGVTASDPFDRGAGSIRANRAVNPTVTFDVTPPAYYGSASDAFGRINLNLPSINAPNMPGTITTTRTIRNVTGVAQTINFSATAPSNSSIKITPSSVSLTPWGTATFSVKIDGQKLADGQYFGQITLDPVAGGYRNAVVPVAFYKQPGDVSLENGCDAPVALVADTETILKGETATCEVSVTNYSSDPAHVQLKVKAPNTGRLLIQNWSDGNHTGNGFTWNGTLGPALPPSVDGLLQYAEYDGYADLSDYAIPGEPGFGDETIVNYDLTSYEVRFGDVTYDTLGVTSDGYIVMGGGTSADVSYIPQDMPDPSSPNNVIAPYWTDLDVSAGGAVRIGFDGCAFYFQWDAVPLYGPGPARGFEVIILTAFCADFYAIPGGDYIEFQYSDSEMGAGASDGLQVGAEDALGLTAAQLGMDVEPDMASCPADCGYYVDTGLSTEGDTMTISYDAFGKKTGTFDVKALMTSDVTQGTAIQTVKIHVINAGP